MNNSAASDIGPRIGALLNTLLEANGPSIETRKQIYANLVHHLAQEHAFLMLEGTPQTDVEFVFNREFDEGLRCAARHHADICKNPDVCDALALLRAYIRHDPKLAKRTAPGA